MAKQKAREQRENLINPAICKQLHGNLKDDILEEVENKMKIKVKNGTEKEMSIGECVGEIYLHTSVLRDVSRIHESMKRLKGYWAFAGIAIVGVAIHKHWDLFEVIKNIIKML